MRRRDDRYLHRLASVFMWAHQVPDSWRWIVVAIFCITGDILDLSTAMRRTSDVAGVRNKTAFFSHMAFFLQYPHHGVFSPFCLSPESRQGSLGSMPASVGYEHIFLFSPIDPCTTWCPTSACLWKAAAALLSRVLRPLHRAVDPPFSSHVEPHATSLYT